MPLPVQRPETREHDVKNEREPERSSYPHARIRAWLTIPFAPPSPR